MPYFKKSLGNITFFPQIACLCFWYEMCMHKKMIQMIELSQIQIIYKGCLKWSKSSRYFIELKLIFKNLYQVWCLCCIHITFIICFEVFVCPPVRMSATFRGNRDLLGPYLIYRFHFSVHIPLLYEHLFYKFFVRRSVSHATKGRNVKV